MKKAIPCLLAALLALALCACDQFDDRYDDEDFLTGKFDSYATISWWSNQGENGSCAMGIGSYTGVRTLYEFTAEQEETLCEVDSTLACTEGEAKLLVDAGQRGPHDRHAARGRLPAAHRRQERQV